MIIQDVKTGRMKSGYVEKPFDEAKAELENAGYSIISLEQFAKLRREQGAGSRISNYGAYTREGFLYVLKKGKFLVRNSPIMVNAKEATQAHRNGGEFYLTDKQVEESLADSVEIKNSKAIPTNRFGENELTVFAFGKEAKKYGEFLIDAGINEMSVYLIDMDNKPFARQAGLRRLGYGNWSGLVGCNRDLSYGNAVRGVRDASADKGSASASRKIISVEDLLNEASRTSSFAPDQVKILGNILEQRGYVIIKK